jgi:hypothetical protein
VSARRALILVLWVLFALCFVAGLLLRRRFTRQLMDAHPAEHARLGAPPPDLFPYNDLETLAAMRAQSRFMQAGDYRGLDDEALNRTGDALRRLTLAQALLGAGFVALVAWEIAQG